MKMEFACAQLAETARRIDAELIFPPIGREQYLVLAKYRLETVPEIDEAWACLDLFPRKLIGEIRIVRNALRKLVSIVSNAPNGTYVWDEGEREPPAPFAEIHMIAHRLWQSAQVIADTLRPILIEAIPEMSQNEKLDILYGDIIDDEYPLDDHADTASLQP